MQYVFANQTWTSLSHIRSQIERQIDVGRKTACLKDMQPANNVYVIALIFCGNHTTLNPQSCVYNELVHGMPLT